MSNGKATKLPPAPLNAAAPDFAAAVKVMDPADMGPHDLDKLDLSYLPKPHKPRAPLPPPNLPAYTGTYVGTEPWAEEGGKEWASAALVIMETRGVQIAFIMKESMVSDMVVGQDYKMHYHPRPALEFTQDKSYANGAAFKMEYHMPPVAGHFHSFHVPPARKSDIDALPTRALDLF